MLDYIVLTQQEKDRLYKLCPVDNKFFSLQDISLPHFVLHIEAGETGETGGGGNSGHLTFEYTADVENKKVWVNVGNFFQLEGKVSSDNNGRYLLGVTGVKKDSRTPDSILRKMLVNEKDNTYVAGYFFGFFLINNYIKNHLPAFIVSKEKVKRDVFYGGKSKDINKRRRVELCSVYRLGQETSTAVGSDVSCGCRFSCPAWGVRGHYRHLKNGKVVFVRPFVKGKERASMSGYKEKEYVI